MPAKSTREFWARLLLGIFLFVFTGTQLIHLTFDSLQFILLLIGFIDSLFWISTLFP